MGLRRVPHYLPPSTPRRHLSLLFGSRGFEWYRLQAYVRVARGKADADQHSDHPHVFIAKGKVSLAGEAIEIGVWQGSDEPDDQGRWASQRIERCMPDLEELRRGFERLLPEN